MDRYYKKWFFPLALPSMILFVVVILVPFLLGAYIPSPPGAEPIFRAEGFGNPLWASKLPSRLSEPKNFWMLFWYTI